MNRRIRDWLLCVCSVLIVSISGSARSGGSSTDHRSSLFEQASEFLRVSKAKSVEGARSLFRSDGFTCTDSTIPIEQIDRDLADRSSYLSTFLFSSRAFHERYDKSRSRTSVAEIVEAEGIPAIRVYFPQLGGKEITSAGCTSLQAAGESNQAEICWVRQGTSWKVDSGLYNCD